MTYREFFRKAYGQESDPDFGPYDYQRRLAEEPWPELLDIPTGIGKTAAVVLAWLWKRRVRDSGTPRRLVYCLPMRVLVEQTVANIEKWLKAHGLYGKPGEGKVSVNVLMGGEEDIRKAEWASYPEEDAILIGTQDMLLSRALMRGYGMSRYQWPIHFAFLHNDALWVYDEVQLMGPGVTTSSQLEAFRRNSPLGKPARSLWVSATLHRDWLATIDLRSYLASFSQLSLSDKDRQEAASRLAAVKRVARAYVCLDTENSKKKASAYIEALADLVRKAHRGDRQTIVILNSVERAQALYRRWRKTAADVPALLLHARFRSEDRRNIESALKQTGSANSRVVIATQAIEAGVDISCGVMFTELAPWPSLVQRFGRCNRYGEFDDGADIYWIDIEADAGAKELLPYSDEQLAEAREIVRSLKSANSQALPSVGGGREIGQVLRRKDFLDLFNTERDLSGFDVDISPYIRDRGAPQAQVFWRDFKDRPGDDEPAPTRSELCPVSLGQLSDYLVDKDRSVWVWDTLKQRWETVDRRRIRPGAVFLLRASDGGYSPDVGFDAAQTSPVEVFKRSENGTNSESHQSDVLSHIGRFVGLTEHLQDVAEQARKLAEALSIDDTDVLIEAGRWHDVGKAHPAFQNMLLAHAEDREVKRGELWAKSADTSRRPKYFIVDDDGREVSRRYFRHELASMLAWLEHGRNTPKKNLIAYLIAAHHGKIRLTLQPLPDEKSPNDDDRYAHGVWEGDKLPAVQLNGAVVPETELKLDVIELGVGAQGPSWAERTQQLLAELGPFRLAWLEALVRIADWRASRMEQTSTETRT